MCIYSVNSITVREREINERLSEKYFSERGIQKVVTYHTRNQRQQSEHHNAEVFLLSITFSSHLLHTTGEP